MSESTKMLFEGKKCRLTPEMVQKILQANEGFESKKIYRSRILEEARTYQIRDGRLYCLEEGQKRKPEMTEFESYVNEEECSAAQVRCFLLWEMMCGESRLKIPEMI